MKNTWAHPGLLIQTKRPLWFILLFLKQKADPLLVLYVSVRTTPLLFFHIFNWKFTSGLPIISISSCLCILVYNWLRHPEQTHRWLGCPWSSFSTECQCQKNISSWPCLHVLVSLCTHWQRIKIILNLLTLDLQNIFEHSPAATLLITSGLNTVTLTGLA